MPDPALLGTQHALHTPAWARSLESLPPALRHRLADVLGRMPGHGGLAGALSRLETLLVDEEAWLGAAPELAGLGHWMIEARHAAELRQLGCMWLAQFPSAETAQRLAGLAIDEATPAPVREQAIRALGARQLRGKHPATRWTAEAIQLADEALVQVASAATALGKMTSEALAPALRHVASDGLAAVFARAPGLWGEALECFASPPLARVLAVSLDDIAAPHRLRVLRLIAATLGEEAVPLMLSRLSRAAQAEQLEMMFLAISLGGDAHVGRLEDAVRGMRFSELLRARAAWHLQHRGVVPTVRGLRVARTTATLAPEERATRCARAAEDLGVLTRYERHAESYLYALWGWMVRGSGDPALARELVSASPASQELVRDLYLEDLARRGQVTQLIDAAYALQGVELAAYQLAVWGRPLAALELAAVARHHTPELVCARALACYRAGRPDLTERILADDLPPSELTDDDALAPFPGQHERWLIEHAGATHPAIAALAGGREAIVALAQPAPHDAEPDVTSLAPITAVVRRLGRGLRGSTIYVAGALAPPSRSKLVAAVEAAGARLVNGPLPGTDYYVRGDGYSVQTIAQLERSGARRLHELEDA